MFQQLQPTKQPAKETASKTFIHSRQAESNQASRSRSQPPPKTDRQQDRLTTKQSDIKTNQQRIKHRLTHIDGKQERISGEKRNAQRALEPAKQPPTQNTGNTGTQADRQTKRPPSTIYSLSLYLLVHPSIYPSIHLSIHLACQLISQTHKQTHGQRSNQAARQAAKLMEKSHVIKKIGRLIEKQTYIETEDDTHTRLSQCNGSVLDSQRARVTTERSRIQ